eukprot:GHVN01069157.1.p1 GENE.GHVN01069157.1~~GHVN01069157.1.p1  ORF type:complete len:681 (+),score=208.92 GHVN01069157.1:192-2234(+)
MQPTNTHHAQPHSFPQQCHTSPAQQQPQLYAQQHGQSQELPPHMAAQQQQSYAPPQQQGHPNQQPVPVHGLQPHPQQVSGEPHMVPQHAHYTDHPTHSSPSAYQPHPHAGQVIRNPAPGGSHPSTSPHLVQRQSPHPRHIPAPHTGRPMMQQHHMAHPSHTPPTHPYNPSMQVPQRVGAPHTHFPSAATPSPVSHQHDRLPTVMPVPRGGDFDALGLSTQSTQADLPTPHLIPFLPPQMSANRPIKISRLAPPLNTNLTDQAHTPQLHQFFISRFPKDSPSLFNMKLSVQRGPPEGGESGLASSPRGDRGDQRVKRRRVNPPMRVSDQGGSSFVGKKEGLDTSTFFILINRGTHSEVIPVSHWRTFQSDGTKMPINSTPSSIGSVKQAALGNRNTSDEAERRMLKAKEEQQTIAMEVKKRVKKETEDEEEEKMKRSTSKGVKTEVFDPQKEMKSQYLKKMLKLEGTKKLRINQENLTYESSLAVRDVRNVEGDWDFEDDWGASDDEGDLGGGADALEEGYSPAGSDEEDASKENLGKLGEDIQHALAHQKENEADEELAQYEAEDEEEEGDGTATGEKGDGDEASQSGSSRRGTQIGDDKGKGVKGRGGIDVKEIREKILRKLNQEGRVTVGAILKTFGLTVQNEYFDAVKAVLDEVCDKHKPEPNASDNQIRLTLKVSE